MTKNKKKASKSRGDKERDNNRKNKTISKHLGEGLYGSVNIDKTNADIAIKSLHFMNMHSAIERLLS